jgi:hypothetical protein
VAHARSFSGTLSAAEGQTLAHAHRISKALIAMDYIFTSSGDPGLQICIRMTIHHRNCPASAVCDPSERRALVPERHIAIELDPRFVENAPVSTGGH